jgi:hypothetical protein
MSDNGDGRFHGLPMIAVPDGPPEVDGTVATPAGATDWCPPCAAVRPVDGKGRFRPHPEANLDPEWPVNCWAGGHNKAEVELAEALAAGSSYESLE